jgi:AmmeMemoRadiSam system protein A
MNHKYHQQLLSTARQAIHHGLVHENRYEVEHGGLSPALIEPRATFVTLHINEQLRGCIGNLEPYEALVDSVAHNAHSAAFHDSRFSPLTEQEFEQIAIHIAILNQPEPISFDDEEHLLSQLRPNIDGLVLKARSHKATFLPAVWEQLPSPIQFLNHLKKKAGLAENYWHTEISVERYTVEQFGD